MHQQEEEQVGLINPLGDPICENSNQPYHVALIQI